MRKEKVITIWKSDIDMSDWEEFLNDEYPDADENERYEIAKEMNDEYLNDERFNLGVATDGEIVIIADLGCWDGRKNAGKLCGHKVSNILYSQVHGMSDQHWYGDGKNICCRESHHDGVNHYTYRIMKGKTHDEQVENADKLFSKKLTARRIGYYTKSLYPVVAEVYGW